MAGPSSGMLDGQLIPIAMWSAIMPPAAPYVVQSQGAATSTLPGNGVGGAATGNGGGRGMVAAEATPEMAGMSQSSAGGKILGLPGIVFGIMAILLVGYLFLWQVHWK